MSLLLLYRGARQFNEGGVNFGRHVSLPKQAVIDARIKAEQLDALQSVIQARQNPVNAPVLPVPPPVKDTQEVTASQQQTANADTSHADALMARLTAGRVVTTAQVEAASTAPEAAEITDDEMYMLMTMAIEVMA